MVGRNRFWGASLAVIALLSGSAAMAETSRVEEPAAPPAGEAAAQVAQQGAQETQEQAAVAGSTPLDTVSVTATRNPIETFEYPGMVTVQGREEIQQLQPSTPDDILKYVPGVEFSGGPRRTGEVPSIRGFSGPDVIVLFDGARQNFDSGHNGRFFIDPSLIKQVEVLRGSASSLYGSGGTGGLIEFRTVDADDLLAPGESYGATASAGYQTVNRETAGTFTGYGKPVEELDLVGSVTKRDSGSIELGNGEELDETDDDIIAGLAKVSYGFAEHHRIEGSFLSFNNDAVEPLNGQGPGSGGAAEKDIHSHTFRAAYSYSNPDDKLLDLDVLAYYTDFQTDELRLDDLGAGPEGELLKRDVDTVGFRVDNRSRLMLTEQIGTTFTYGVEAYRDTQNGESADGDREGVPDAQSTFYGLFAQAEVAIAEPFGFLPGDFLIIPGLRFDSFRSTSDIDASNEDRAVSPRIGASYLPTEWLMGFVSYGHAFRAPTFNEIYSTGVHFAVGGPFNNFFIPNPDLKPQRTRTLEFGAGLDFDDVFQTGDRLQLKASQYHIWGKDFIDLEVFQPGFANGTTQSVNVDKAKLQGKELEASYDGPRFLASIGYSTIDGENEDTEAKLGVLTPDRWTLIAGVKLPEIDSIVGWRAIIADEFDKVNEADEVRDAYDTHDIFFAWQPSDGMLQGLRVDLGVDNIFDEDYARINTFAPEPGRNFKGLVSYTMKW